MNITVPDPLPPRTDILHRSAEPRYYVLRRDPIPGQHRPAFKYSGADWDWSNSITKPGFPAFTQARKILRNRHDAIICVEAGREVYTCQGCGCTDTHACPSGCSWSQAWICSNCAPRD